MMKICDIHTHVLPGIDDGAQSREIALQMLANAVAGEVETLVATPHLSGADDADAKMAFLRLKKAAEALPIQLLLGGEVRFTKNLSHYLRRGSALRINGSRYLLTEFPADTPAEAFVPGLKEILACGYVPLVAHPERYYSVVKKPNMVEDWLDLGCHLQLTGGSIRGDYGKTVQSTAKALFQGDYVACVASDAHDVTGRSNFLMDIFDHLSVHYSRGYARCMLYTNPMAICHDETI